MKTEKYVLTGHVVGANAKDGIVELTAEQAAHPLWKNRVRPMDKEVHLKPATPEATSDEETKRRGRPPKSED